LKAAFCPALASSGPVCPGIALLLAHCLAARPLPPGRAVVTHEGARQSPFLEALAQPGAEFFSPFAQIPLGVAT